jgi:hypothetical protein
MLRRSRVLNRAGLAFGASRANLRAYLTPGWWAHFELTRINIEPIIFRNKIEDLSDAAIRRSLSGNHS